MCFSIPSIIDFQSSTCNSCPVPSRVIRFEPFIFSSKKFLTVRDDRKKINDYLYEQDKKFEELKKIETITHGMNGRGE